MQNIEFNENEELQWANGQTVQNSEKPSFMMGLLEKAGVGDKTTANFILAGVAGIGFGITIFLYAGMFSEPKKDLALDAQAIIIMTGNRQ